jgi:hypothetical protein
MGPMGQGGLDYVHWAWAKDILSAKPFWNVLDRSQFFSFAWLSWYVEHFSSLALGQGDKAVFAACSMERAACCM